MTDRKKHHAYFYPDKSFEQRLKETVCYEAFSPERYKSEEKFRRKYGRNWPYFSGYVLVLNRDKRWIEQFDDTKRKSATHDLYYKPKKSKISNHDN